MPQACPCCASDPDTELEVSFTRRSGKRVIREQTRSWSFPYCRRCVAHVNAWNAAGTMALGTLAIGVVAGIVLGLTTSASGVGLAVFALSLPTALALAIRQRGVARRKRSAACVSTGVSVNYLGWDGSVQGFAFDSYAYAARFALANTRSLINVSAELRRLLDTVREQPARIEATTTAPPRPPDTPTAAPPERTDAVLDWIARIESYKGQVARRNALKRALDEITDPDGRRTLLLAASKIEATAVLDKVDSLATAPAKRRHLERAISELRTDDVPDELQAEELAMLEAALRALGTK